MNIGLWLYKKLYDISSKKLDMRAIRKGDVRLKLTLGEHAIKHEYVDPNNEDEEDERAWDDSYANGCIFPEGYANTVHHTEELELPEDLPAATKEKIKKDTNFGDDVKMIG